MGSGSSHAREETDSGSDLSGQFNKYFLPPREDHHSLYEQAFLEQAHQGLLVIGIIFILLPLAGTVGLTVAWISGLDFLPQSSVRWVGYAHQGVMVSLGMATLLWRKRDYSLTQARWALACILMVGVILGTRTELLLSYNTYGGHSLFLYILAIAVFPFRPLQSLALGLTANLVTRTVLEFSSVDAQLTGIGERLLSIGTLLSFVGMVITAAIYRNRAATADRYKESAELKEQLHQLAVVAEASPVPILRFDLQGQLLWSNPAATNYAKRQGRGHRTILDYLPEGFQESIKGNSQSSHTQTANSYLAHGRHFNLSFKTSPEVKELIVTLHDITAQMEAHEKVLASKRELEKAHQQLKETQMQLVQSEKMAALGNLVAGVAHEINTPMGAISANADISQKALAKLEGACMQSPLAEAFGDSKPANKAVKVLKQTGEVTLEASRRITEIVRSLRSFARLDEAERDRVQIHEGIDNTLLLIQHELKGRIEVIKNYGELPLVTCFPNQLNQVFMNVLVNATQAIEGPGQITVTTAVSQDRVTVQIKDSGRGIEEAHLKRVFDPGFTTKGVGVGTGLGLSISYRIIQAHQGKISLASELGKGTTVTIELPLQGTQIETSDITSAANAEDFDPVPAQ